ncbi:MAG TPA: ClpX C4-type zinc finger protein [Candidatus Elarobacter sp.]|nr:ClpX C4-type zinc finger protein [Candidatus Elarobacter sp.]
MMKLWKLRCSFCKKTDTEVSKLVAGPGVHICDECVSIAARLMDAPPVQPAARRSRSLWQSIVRGIRRVLGVNDIRHITAS